MAIINIGHHPELTKEQAREIFAKRFAGKYEITSARAIGRDFVVKQSGFVGVGVRLQQQDGATSFVYSAMIPSILFRSLFGGLIAYLFLRRNVGELEQAVEEFMRTAPEFK